MKKSILIYVAVFAAISVAAYGFTNKSNSATDVEENSCRESNIPDYFIEIPHNFEPKPDFFYDVDSRFNTTVTKEKLQHAESILEIVPKEATEGIESFKTIKIAILPESVENTEISTSGTLNSTQLDLLQSLDYSTNFYIRADFQPKSPYTGKLVGEHLIYYITVVPQKEAEYKGGTTALINYLEQNSKQETAHVTKDRLKSGKVRFTVTQNGEIGNVKLESTSGYTSIDNTMIELITKMPGKWDSATNYKGEKVDQELVFSFGIIGC